jgi:hypothetical protein
MNQLSREFLQRLRTAAELRAAGLSWEVVAGRVGRAAATCSRWPSRYADLWRSVFREAVRQSEQESAIEARATLRKMLRGEDDRQKLTAAQQLLKAPRPRPRGKRMIAPEDRVLAAFISQLRSVSDEELDRIAREVVETSGHPAGVEGPAGAA